MKNLFRKKTSKERLPTYVLVDRLPSSVGPRLLGLIVADIVSPLDYYRPRDIKEPSKTEELQKQGTQTLEAAVAAADIRNLGEPKTAAGEVPHPGDQVTASEIPEEPKSTTTTKQKDPKADPGGETQDGTEAADSKLPIKTAKTLSETLGGEELEITDSDFSTLFSTAKNAVAEAKVGQILGGSSDKGATLSNTTKSKFVRTRFLTQHKDVLTALMRDHREQVLELLQDQKDGRAYMIVGFKTAVEGTRSLRQESHAKTTISAAFPVGTIVQGASHGTVNPGTSVDPQFTTTLSSEASLDTSSGMVGEQIFAVRYRIVSLKRARRGTEAGTDYGDIKRVNYEDGVYGREDREPQFAEDEFADAEEWEDADVELSNEGVKSIVKKLGLTATVSRFDN